MPEPSAPSPEAQALMRLLGPSDEPDNAWSVANLIDEHGNAPLAAFAAASLSVHAAVAADFPTTPGAFSPIARFTPSV